jgi:hypothetical protein
MEPNHWRPCLQEYSLERFHHPIGVERSTTPRTEDQILMMGAPHTSVFRRRSGGPGCAA